MTAAGTTTHYGYDTSSILTSVTTGSQTVTFGLDAVGRERTASLPGGFTRTTGYDRTGVTTAIGYTRGGAGVGDLTYTRDERGLQTGLAGSLASVALPAAESGAVFGKDNRITTFNGRSFTDEAEGRLAARPRLRRGSCGRPPAFDREAYKQRNTVERWINRLEQWRGLTTRYDKTATVYLAGIFIWSR